MTTLLPIGKLPAEMLLKLLDRYTRPDPRLVVGPRVGEDAAVLDMGDRYLVAKTDPITFATDAIGWYCVNVNANDIAAMGAEPRWFLATILLPEGKATEELADRVFAQLAHACREINVTLCGGHTEITYGLDRPIVVGQMLGEVEKDQLVTSAGARPGDVLLLTKGISVEGTSIIAREKADDLRGLYPEEWLQRCQGFLHDPGISVVRDALIAREAGSLHAMHDPTEGGLSTGLYELAQASGVGLWIDGDALPIFPETEELCRRFGLDPLGVIASGALLIAVEPDDAERVTRALAEAGIACRQIGRVVELHKGVQMRRAGRTEPLPRFPRDEIARLFE